VHPRVGGRSGHNRRPTTAAGAFVGGGRGVYTPSAPPPRPERMLRHAARVLCAGFRALPPMRVRWVPALWHARCMAVDARTFYEPAEPHMCVHPSMHDPCVHARPLSRDYGCG
jgi:hypothetical protein